VYIEVNSMSNNVVLLVGQTGYTKRGPVLMEWNEKYLDELQALDVPPKVVRQSKES